jgi:Repeat of unknown function (DUF6923)
MADRPGARRRFSTIAGVFSGLLLAAAGLRGQVEPELFDCTESFFSTGLAFIVQDTSAKLFRVDRSGEQFVFDQIGGPAGLPIEVNNMGFRRLDGSRGLLYAVLLEGAERQLVRLDRQGQYFLLEPPRTLADLGIDPLLRYDAGAVSFDGAAMYINRAGTGKLWKVDLTTVDTPGTTAVSVDVHGALGRVNDWGFNPANGLLYGGDRDQGQVAILDPATGLRTDHNVAGLPADTGQSETLAYGAAWFNASGRLFLYRNNGFIYEIDLSGAAPALRRTHKGPQSNRNDGAICVPDPIGAAKRMIVTSTGLPATVTLRYVFENFSTLTDLRNLTVPDDLSAVFGVHGVDWAFVSISSSTGVFHNPSFDGHGDTELVNQSPTQSLARSFTVGSTASITVTISLLTLAAADVDGNFCNQVQVSAQIPGTGFIAADLSTDGDVTDPNGDRVPIEHDPSCFHVDDVPVTLTTFSID